VQTAEPSRDVLRALLILSYCPNRRYEAPFASPDPFRAAALALDIAKNMCLDLTVSRLPALRVADMQHDWNKRLLDDACLVSASNWLLDLAYGLTVVCNSTSL
jgi:hypothetical protein